MGAIAEDARGNLARGELPAAGGGGGTNYTITPSGGMALSGLAAYIRGKVFGVAGGLAFAGAAAYNRGKVFAPAGGASFGGTAAYIRGKVFSSSGGLLFSGTAPLRASNIVLAVSGGIAFAGHVILDFTAIAAASVRDLLRLSYKIFGRRALKQRK